MLQAMLRKTRSMDVVRLVNIDAFDSFLKVITLELLLSISAERRSRVHTPRLGPFIFPHPPTPTVTHDLSLAPHTYPNPTR